MSSLLYRHLALRHQSRPILHALILAQNSFPVATTTNRVGQDIPLVTKTSWMIIHRGKHGGKRAQHLQTLQELGNRKEKHDAQESRKKKKNRKAVRAGKSANFEDETTLEMNQSVESDEEEEEESNGDILPDPKDVKTRLKKHLDSFTQYLRGVRGSEPTPELFDDVVVMDAYGSGTGSTPLQSVAQVVISSPTLAVATCYVS